MAFGRRDTAPAGSGAYEVWVAALRRWGAEPDVSLDSLPMLSESAYDRASFTRFADHMNAAIVAFMARWDAQFAAELSRASTAHDMSVALVRVRNALRPRLALARHESLPEGVRSALMTGLTNDLNSIQTQLEASVRIETSRGSVDPGLTDMMLGLARDNSFLSLLRDPVDASLVPPPTPHDLPAPPPAPGRRIFTPTQPPTP